MQNQKIGKLDSGGNDGGVNPHIIPASFQLDTIEMDGKPAAVSHPSLSYRGVIP